MIVASGVFVVKQLVGYALKKKLDKFLEKKYVDKLANLIDKTIEEFISKYPIDEMDGKFPFYKSQIIIDELLKYRFFKDNDYVLDEDRIKEELKSNPNILRPDEKEIKQFVELFEANLKEDADLKKLAIKENYQEEIFEISQKFTPLFQQLDRMEQKIDKIERSVKGRINHSGEIPKQITNVQRRPIDDVVGRRKDIINLKKTLNEKHRTVLMNGMGGIGKTTIAEAYVETNYELYKHIVWINVEGDFKEAVLSNFRLIRNLGLEGIPLEQQFDACMNELCNLKGPNLLVIDNAKLKLTTYYDHLPKAPDWQVLITSRERIERFYIMNIDFLSVEDAMVLFKIYCSKFNDEQIKMLVEKLELHTLTIEVLSKATKRNKWSFEQCLTALGKDATVNITTSRSNHEKIIKIKTYLTEIFNATKLNEQEKWILKQFVALPPFDIEYDFLYNLLQVEKLDWANDFPAILEGLYETGFLQKNTKNDSYKLHAVLNEVLRSSLKPTIEEITQLLEAVIALLSEDQTKDSPTDKFLFIPFGVALIEMFPKISNPNFARLKNVLGIVYKNKGEYNKALELSKQAVRMTKDNLGGSHLNVARCSINLSHVYFEMGRFKKAQKIAEQALSLAQEVIGKNDSTIFGFMANLGLINSKLGENENARNLLQQSWEFAKENLGNSHPITITRLSNLAVVYSQLEEYEKARDLLEFALLSDIENLGEEHPNVAIRQSNLATVFAELNDFKSAKILLRKALNSNMKNFGEQHPFVALDKSNLANVLYSLNEFGEVKELILSAYKTTVNFLGKDHPRTKKILQFIDRLKGENLI